MLIEIYILLAVIGTVFTLASFLQAGYARRMQELKVNVFLPAFATVIYLVLALSSVHVEYHDCSIQTDKIVVNNTQSSATAKLHNYTNSYKCTVDYVEQPAVTYLWMGLGIVMLLFFIVTLLDEGLVRNVKQMQRETEGL